MRIVLPRNSRSMHLKKRPPFIGTTFPPSQPPPHRTENEVKMERRNPVAYYSYFKSLFCTFYFMMLVRVWVFVCVSTFEAVFGDRHLLTEQQQQRRRQNWNERARIGHCVKSKCMKEWMKTKGIQADNIVEPSQKQIKLRQNWCNA